MIKIDDIEVIKQRKLATTWSVSFLIIFPLLIVLGYIMRLNQGELIEIKHDTFYAIMTLHGLGMISIIFSIAFAGLWYIVGTRYANLNLKVGYFFYFMVIIGLIGLAVGGLIGKFGPGWYLLYPMPFVGGYWQEWATKLSIISLIILGVAWLVGTIHVVYSISKQYGGFSNIVGWQYLRKKREDDRETPPIVMITAISLIPGILAGLVGAIMLIMYLIQAFEPSVTYDPLIMKNMVMFFGHTIANIAMYCCLGWVYTLLPEFTGRPWKTDKVLVLSWNATFFFIVFAFLHHMYMDHVQPTWLQYIGQVASYGSAVPATAITMFGVIKQLYHSKVRWSVIPLMFLLGTAGWAIGGFSAIVDSTIAFNKLLHNTLWVPAHFHTYLLMGVALFVFAFMFYLFSNKNEREIGGLAKFGFWTFVTGSYGFLLMFYLSGMESVPRRYSKYGGILIERTKDVGIKYSATSAIFIAVLFLGLLLMYITLFSKLAKRKKEAAEALE